MEVLKKEGVEKNAVMMSIVFNTRVDIVARGVIKACLEPGNYPAETIAIFGIPGAMEERARRSSTATGSSTPIANTSMWEAAGEGRRQDQGGSGG